MTTDQLFFVVLSIVFMALAYGVGYTFGWHRGVRETEIRWHEAVSRTEAARKHAER